MSNSDQLLEKVGLQLPYADKDRIRQAFEYADKCLAGQYRPSGDLFIDHALAVVDVLLTIHADESSIIATLLHSLPETSSYDLAEIERRFGRDVSSLVAAMAMLNKLKTVSQESDVESLRKMFLAMAKDIRVVLIKLADRLCNMQVLDCQPVAMRKRMAKETLDIYVPIAARMGIYSLKGMMEDMAFRYLYPRQYENINAQLNDYKSRRGKTMNEIMVELRDLLKEHGIEAEVDGRIKNLYSIYKKLKLKSQSTIDDIYDVFAIRIIVSTKENSKGEEQSEQLYAILGLIHSRWKPLTNRFKDYIAVPKPNGYQSLHTAVLGLSPQSYNQPTEIQIRSRRMHEQAEFGVASHWVYEDTKKTLLASRRDGRKQDLQKSPSEIYNKYVGWLDALSLVQKDISDQGEMLETLKLDVFTDRIFVLTPNGQVKDLPVGATPVDFAYAVHTDVGHRCQLVKVNGSVVPLNYELKNGEVVEVITGNKSMPKLQWLSFVKTVGARNKIRAYFKGLDKEKSFRDGKEIMNKYLLRMKMPQMDDNLSLLKHYSGQKLSFKDRIALVEEIGNGSVLAAPVMKKIFGKKMSDNSIFPDASVPKVEVNQNIILPQKKLKTILHNDNIFIAGETGVPYHMAQCCKPSPGEPIVGYVTRDHAVTIHSENCKLLREAQQQRVIEASWDGETHLQRFPVRIQLRAKDRVGLIRDIADVISSFNVNILDFGREEKIDREIVRQLVLEVNDNRQFSDMMTRLQRVRNMLEVIQGS